MCLDYSIRRKNFAHQNFDRGMQLTVRGGGQSGKSWEVMPGAIFGC